MAREGGEDFVMRDRRDIDFVLWRALLRIKSCMTLPLPTCVAFGFVAWSPPWWIDCCLFVLLLGCTALMDFVLL